MRDIAEFDEDDILRALEVHTCHVKGWGAAQATLTLVPSKTDGRPNVEVKVTRLPSPEDRD